MYLVIFHFLSILVNETFPRRIFYTKYIRHKKEDFFICIVATLSLSPLSLFLCIYSLVTINLGIIIFTGYR